MALTMKVERQRPPPFFGAADDAVAGGMTGVDIGGTAKDKARW